MLAKVNVTSVEKSVEQCHATVIRKSDTYQNKPTAYSSRDVFKGLPVAKSKTSRL